MANLTVGSGGTYATIQAAINAAASGDTILIAAGTYREQITVNGKDLTIHGAGSGLGGTIIESPNSASLVANATDSNNSGRPNKFAVITIKSDADVTIDGLAVDGREQGFLNRADYDFAGIYVLNSDAHINGVAVSNIDEIVGPATGGAQRNHGILATSHDVAHGGNGAHTVTIEHSTVSNFQKNGIFVNGPTLTADIHDNTITGSETGNQSQNGIQFGSSGAFAGAKGTIDHNTITDIDNPNGGAAGILVFHADASLAITNNDVSGTNPNHQNSGIVVLDSNGAIVQGNSISGFAAALTDEDVFGPETTLLSHSGNIYTNNAINILLAPAAAGTAPITFTGSDGHDELHATAAADTLSGGAGSDTIDGGDGTDTAVYSGLRSQYQATQNSDGSIHIFDLRSGAPDGADDVSNVEFFQFSDGTVGAASLLNHAPVVSVPTPTVQATSSQAIAVSTLFNASDVDNDTLSYLFFDNTPGGGHFAVNGVEQAAGQIFGVTSAQLSQTTFVPVPDGSDNLLVGATDGMAFSGWSNLHIDGPVNHAPVVTLKAPSANVQENSTQPIQVSTLFSVSDLDNDTLAYEFYDATPGGGHFAVNGVEQAAGQIFAVSAAQLLQTTFVSALDSSDNLLVGATDGMAFSGWSSLHVDGPVNHAPVVTVPNPTVQATSSQAIALSTLVSASDLDNDTLTYVFYDATPGSGHFAVNGVEQAAGQIFGVTAAQLSQTTFVPALDSSDNLLVGATDGHVFSGWSNLHIDGPVNHAPVVTVPNPTVQATPGQQVALSPLFSATDPDHDTLTYLFFDNTPGGGHFDVNGMAQPEGQIFGVAAAQLSQTTFVAGQGGTDDLLVGATDGHVFSGWSGLHIQV